MLEIRDTHVGKGVFAKLRIPAKTFIGKITGKIIKDSNHSSDYCMDLGDDYSLEPDQPFRYMNHSCDPNCELMCDEDSKDVWVEAIKLILINDELCIDYGWAAEGAIECQCGARNCRGWIVDPEELHLVDESSLSESFENESSEDLHVPDPVTTQPMSEESSAFLSEIVSESSKPAPESVLKQNTEI